METYATTKGQIVIPSSVRRKLGITEGTRIQIEVDEKANKIILTPVTRAYIHSLRGKYKGKGLLKALAADKAKEKER
jgi:AbrB family looped-hinge helix DNA binding protein